MKLKNTMKYEDIIKLPHHVSEKYPQMAIGDRAAQFSPFAALTGHGAAIREMERLTERRIELDECYKNRLNKKLQTLIAQKGEKTAICVTYFIPDKKKDGGRYARVNGNIKSINIEERALVLVGGRKIPLDQIYDIEKL